MPIDFQKALAIGERDRPFAYDDARTMLYALAIGMGRDPLDAHELAFVYEKDLRVVPTLATVVAWGAFDVRTLGVDYAKVLHGEQRLTVHSPLPKRASLLADTRVTGVHDKGPGKGALIVSEVTLRDAVTSKPYCTLETVHFARGDGGFSRDGQDSGPASNPHILPEREPDTVCRLSTTPNQALIYRLLGDRNVLHADPEAAMAAGFGRPILHGLCTYGICCHAVLKTYGDYRPERIRRFDVRFSAPVTPGETLRVEMWRDGEVVSFRALSEAREVVVVNNGLCLLQ